jgi:hypothetical protein
MKIRIAAAPFTAASLNLPAGKTGPLQTKRRTPMQTLRSISKAGFVLVFMCFIISTGILHAQFTNGQAANGVLGPADLVTRPAGQTTRVNSMVPTASLSIRSRARCSLWTAQTIEFFAGHRQVHWRMGQMRKLC